MKRLGILWIICIVMITACGQNKQLDTENITNIKLEYIENDKKDVNEIVLSEEDVCSILDILADYEVHIDKGFVFAEGMYRIVLEHEKEDKILYPYCGNGTKLRVGERGNNYIDISDEDKDILEKIIGAYIEIKGGVYEWSDIIE